jgi:hypothetical protein
MIQKQMSTNSNVNNNEKVLMIGNRLANLNVYKKSDIDPLNHSQDQLDALLQHQTSINSNSIKNKLHSSNSLHVDSAVSISGGSQQSTPHAVPQAPVQAAPPPPPPPAPPAPAVPLRDDAQLVDIVSSFLFPISFIIFNIVYWITYLNMEINHTG